MGWEVVRGCRGQGEEWREKRKIEGVGEEERKGKGGR